MQYQKFDSCFIKLTKLGQGSFGKVYLCKKRPNIQKISNQNENISNTSQKPEKQPNQYFALKKLKQFTKNVEELRQVRNLKIFNHKNLINMHSIVHQDKQYKQNHFIVMDYGVQILQFAKQKEIYISNDILKGIMLQIVYGIKQIHDKNYIHRDIKPSNIFMFYDGSVKLGDFSITRQKAQEMTGNVITRYYRPPQIIYGSKKYDQSIDMWSLGCCLAELVLHQPLFPGQSDINQLELIFKTIGYPQHSWQDAKDLPYYMQFPQDQQSKKLCDMIPNIEKKLLDLIEKLLVLDPKKRLAINEVCKHPYFENAPSCTEQISKLYHYLSSKKLKEYK